MFAQPHEAGLSGKRSKRGGQEWRGGAESEATWTVTGGREARGVSSCARSAGSADRQGRETHRAQHAPTPRSGVRGGVGSLKRQRPHTCLHTHTRAHARTHEDGEGAPGLSPLFGDRDSFPLGAPRPALSPGRRGGGHTTRRALPQFHPRPNWL